MVDMDTQVNSNQSKETTNMATNDNTSGATQVTSKAEAVRQAIGKLGNDATPGDIAAWVNTNFGISITNAHVSQIKSLQGRKGGKGGNGRRGGGRGRGRPAQTNNPAGVNGATNQGGSNNGTQANLGMTETLNLVKEMQMMEQKYGREAIKQVVGTVLG
jgi:hypothetical protein